MSGIGDLIKGFNPKGITEGAIKGTLNGVMGILDEVITNKEELAEIEVKLKEVELKETQEANRLNEAYLADTQQARTSEVERIKVSNSWLTKNLNAVLALGVIGLSFILFGVLALIKVEPTQKDIIIYVLGALTTFVGQIVAYYFGSSKSSSDKTDQINKMIKP